MANDPRKVVPEQLTILMDAIENDSSLLANRNMNKGERILLMEKWQVVSKKLHAIKNGAVKSVPKWQQAWRDFKSNTRRKFVERPHEEMTPTEKRLLAFLEDHDDASSYKIDTDNITEANVSGTLSDDDSDDDGEGTNEEIAKVTVYQEHSTTNGERQIKRRRIGIYNEKGETISHKHTELLCKLVELEKSRQDLDRHQSQLLLDTLVALERQTNAVERQAAATERQAEVLTRIAAAIDRWRQNEN